MSSDGRLKPDGTPREETDFDSDDRLGLFPKGWKVRKLRQVVRLKNLGGCSTQVSPTACGFATYRAFTAGGRMVTACCMSR